MVNQVASDGILQFSKNRIVSLEIRDMENLLFSTAYLKPRIYSFLSTISFRSTHWPSGLERTHKDNSDTTDRNDFSGFLWTLFTTLIDWILIQIIHLLLINNS